MRSTEPVVATETDEAAEARALGIDDVGPAGPATDDAGSAFDDRYGRTPQRASRRRLLGWVAGIAVAAVFAAWVVWVASDGTGGQLESRDLGFSLVDDSTIDVQFELSVPAGTEVSCALEARNDRHAVVGWKVIDLPASERYTRTFTETLRTVELPVTGLIHSCWLN